MSEILTINTTDSLVQKQEEVRPLPLFDDNYEMLQRVMPEYTDTLPNPVMINIIKRLKMTMKQFGGIGLSANQCGVQSRVFILGYGEESFACINPKIIEVYDEPTREREGCLSFPGMYLSVLRYNKIRVEFTTEAGETLQMELNGITARCFQHELDHLNGIRYTNHVGPTAIAMAKKKQAKIMKTVQRKLKRKDGLFV
jgi:peptide deformylase